MNEPVQHTNPIPNQNAQTIDSWLFSDNFLKRSFAIWGHFMVAHLIIFIGIGILFFIVALIFMMIFGTMIGFEDATPSVTTDEIITF